MKLLLTGDSHLGGVRRALIAAQSDLDASTYEGITVRALGRGFLMRSAFFADRGDHAEIVDGEFRRRVERVPPRNGRYEWIGISGPLNTARVWRDSTWSRYKPFSHAGGIPVSTALLRSVVEADVRRSIEFVQVVGRTSRVFVIEAPWPFAAHRAVAQSSARTVQFIHQWYREYVMAELQRLQIPVLEIDKDCVDAQGFMKPEFRHETPTDRYHANARFGRVVLDRMIAQFAPESGVSRSRQQSAASTAALPGN